MVEDARDVEVVEEVGVLRHAVGVVLGHVLEVLHELAPPHHFHLALELTDHILELVVDQQSAIAILGVLHHLIGDRSRYLAILVPVGKLRGRSMCVIAVSMRSPIVLERATEPLSPTTNSL